MRERRRAVFFGQKNATSQAHPICGATLKGCDREMNGGIHAENLALLEKGCLDLDQARLRIVIMTEYLETFARCDDAFADC